MTDNEARRIANALLSEQPRYTPYAVAIAAAYQILDLQRQVRHLRGQILRVCAHPDVQNDKCMTCGINLRHVAT